MNSTQTTNGCGGGHCACASGSTATDTPVAMINGIALQAPGEQLPAEELRERAWAELLRQEAVRQGLLPRLAVLEMPVLSAQEHEIIGQMVDSAVPMPEPTEDETRRYYEGHLTRFVEGAQARLRHILFAVTEGVDVSALAARAEKTLLELSHKEAAPGRFAELARELSNCPSGTDGGELGWVTPQEIAPELSAELFHQTTGAQPTGLRPRLVHSRFGFHVMEVLERTPGRQLSFDEAQPRIASLLTQQSRARALHQYIRVLAGRARVEGIELESSTTPLVQ